MEYKNNVFISDKIEVRNSKIHGKGVFAKSPIKSGEIIEACHFIFLDNKNWESVDNNLKEYVFSWPRDVLNGKSAVVLGWGSIYNHSKNNNADWRTDLENNLFVFYTKKDIEIGEEICTNYGDLYEQVVKKL
jgi:SET domain-containing protein